MRSFRGRGSFRAVGLVALAVLPLQGAHAEEGEAEAVDDPRNRIVVTATRQPRSLFSQAGNTAVLDEETLDLIRPNHISEALNRLPGVFIHRNSGVDHLTAIRSPVLTGGAGAGSFLYLQDGVPLRAAGFANVNGLFEAQTEFASGIEVVRGPGSVLYGSNAVHGLINVLLPEPGAGPGFLASASAGSFGRYRGQAQVSGTIGDHTYLAGLNLANDDGWRDETGIDQQKLLLRWGFENGPLSVTTTLTAQNLNQETAGFIRGPRAYESSAQSRTNPTPDAFRDARSVRFASRIEWEGDGGFSYSVTPYLRWTELAFRLTFLPSQALEENDHASAGVLGTVYWESAQGHEIIFGADLEVTEGSLREFQSIPTVFSFTQGLHYDYDITALVGAGYVQGTWNLTERLDLTGGVRIEATRYDYNNNTDADVVGRFLRPADRTDTFVTVTPKISALYALNEDMVFYARYARGARAPQTTDLYRLQINQQVADVEVETLDSIEGGVRAVLGRLSADLSGYYAVKRNFFFRDTDGFNVTDGRTRHVGVELESLLEITDTVSLGVSGTYARHTYRFDNTVSANSTETIRFGDDVDSAPRLLANTRLIWQPVPAFTGEVEWIYVDEYFTDASNSNRYPGHQVVNLRGSWQVSAHIEIFASVINLMNNDYANRADFSFGTDRYFPAEDRAYNGGITVTF